MKHQDGANIFPRFILLIALVFLHSSSISAQEVEDEREFDYSRGSVKGPARWGMLKKEWAVCSKGTHQSPIDLSSPRVNSVTNLGRLKRSYKPTNATLKNRGHDISLYFDGDAGSILVNKVTYNLKNFHWHSPSEHTVNGRRYDMEVHMVHMSSDEKIAVVSQLYRLGEPDPFLSQLTGFISGMLHHINESKVGVLNPEGMDPKGRKYYRYLGSLTVPPCTEGVVWTINRKIKTVSKEQVKLLREVVHDYATLNARPLQPLNTRKIYLFDPKPRN